ncbi:hypothetical protein NHQ30_005016 [Ciborinia camelliae]|nr:hypothetical protein NHQ30_005016 [Ciborinia camelliae]
MANEYWENLDTSPVVEAVEHRNSDSHELERLVGVYLEHQSARHTLRQFLRGADLVNAKAVSIRTSKKLDERRSIRVLFFNSLSPSEHKPFSKLVFTSRTMVLKLEVCSDADMARTFEIISTAFGHEHPYNDAAFPMHDTPAGRALGASRMLEIKKTDPCTTFLKVIDNSSGVMVAQAKWNIYKNTIPPELDLDGDFWDTSEDKEYAQLLYREYLIPRRKAIKESGGNILSLDILTVDPNYQRQGAGRLLVKWGTSLADELGFMPETKVRLSQAVVEATDCGRPLYESEGFQYVDTWETTLPEKWKNKGKQKFIWMTRPARNHVEVN